MAVCQSSALSALRCAPSCALSMRPSSASRPRCLLNCCTSLAHSTALVAMALCRERRNDRHRSGSAQALFLLLWLLPGWQRQRFGIRRAGWRVRFRGACCRTLMRASACLMSGSSSDSSMGMSSVGVTSNGSELASSCTPGCATRATTCAPPASDTQHHNACGQAPPVGVATADSVCVSPAPTLMRFECVPSP